MSDQEKVRPPRKPEGRYKRLWMEMEVEVVDEMALRTFDLHPMGDGEGNMVGLVDMDVNERVGYAISQVMHAALRERAAEIGIQWMGSSGPTVRYLGDDGQYTEMTLPKMPNRRDDGEVDDDWMSSPPPTE